MARHMHAAEVANFPSILFGQEWENYRSVCKNCSHRMVIGESVEGLTVNFLSERKGKGLTFAANARFWIKNYSL